MEDLWRGRRPTATILVGFILAADVARNPFGLVPGVPKEVRSGLSGASIFQTEVTLTGLSP
jgi:hypothetical protein